jgi:hypothetical protein
MFSLRPGLQQDGTAEEFLPESFHTNFSFLSLMPMKIRQFRYGRGV